MPDVVGSYPSTPDLGLSDHTGYYPILNDRALGAQVHGDVTTFRVYSSVAAAVDLCLITTSSAAREHVSERRISMTRAAYDPHIWTATVPVGAGQRYGYRVFGPFERSKGLHCNPAKLLLDPYGQYVEVPQTFGVHQMNRQRDFRPDGGADHFDTLRTAPWSVVVEALPNAARGRPHLARGERVIYEAHLQHLTRNLPDIDDELRGTFMGLQSEFLVEHLLKIGATTLELLPVMHSMAELALAGRGQRNVWGYNPIGFFSPLPRYCYHRDIAGQWAEIADAVSFLHSAGIEVVFDVVYNHTAEGFQNDPTYHLRGLDNLTYYRTVPGMPSRYDDVTGCGNTLNAEHPVVQDLIVESLRHWVRLTDIDGFRFDLASTLGRVGHGFTPSSPMLEAISQDPRLGDRVLIAEPWDVGAGGYQLGSYLTPTRHEPWGEWNDAFRTAVRDFWRPNRAPGAYRGALTRALAGSAEIFGASRRPATSSVNYVTAHDGFTLRDLVSYDVKHNLENGENNRDGTDDNRSWNGGVEGETDDRRILELRLRRQASMLTVLMLSLGTPMLTAGDELDRTQRGNNNAYCLDAAHLALTWEPSPNALALTELMQVLARVRRERPQLYGGEYLTAPEHPERGRVVRWHNRDGQRISDAEWGSLDSVLLAQISGTDRESGLLLAFNGSVEPATIRLPSEAAPQRWRQILDTSELDRLTGDPETELPAGASYQLAGFSAIVLAD